MPDDLKIWKSVVFRWH